MTSPNIGDDIVLAALRELHVGGACRHVSHDVNPPAGGAECHHDDDLCGERRARSAGGPTETARSGDGGNPGGSTLSGYELVGGRIGLAGRCRLGFDPRMLI